MGYSTDRQADICKFVQERFEGIQSVALAEDGTLYVDLCGKCADCPMRELTLEKDVTDSVLAEFPEIQRVISRASVSEEMLSFVKKLLGL